MEDIPRSKGIRLDLDSDNEIVVFKEKPKGPKCLIGQCEYAREDWKCFSSGKSIWDHYHNPGWCPLFKWYRASKAKEFKAWSSKIQTKMIENESKSI